MSEWVIALEGTDDGHRVALALALFAAVLHALFGAMQKARFDPWTSRSAIDLSYGLLAMPVALLLVPWPEPEVWPILAVAFVIHAGYKIFQAMAYSMADFTVVYPVVRGTGPLVVALAAGVVFAEHFTSAQWAGIIALTGGLCGLGILNIYRFRLKRAALAKALMIAVLTGLFVAAYTTVDAYGMRAVANPFTFIAWLFFIDGAGLVMPALAYLRWRRSRFEVDLRKLLGFGMTGACVGVLSFGSIMLATRIGNVGEAAALRETSTVFAAFFGWLMLGERVGARRLILMAVIAGGAVLVEVGN